MAQFCPQPPGVCQDHEPADESPDADDQVNGWAETRFGGDQQEAQYDLENPQDEAAPGHAARQIVRAETTEDMQQAGQQHDEADEIEDQLFAHEAYQ
mgnify:CR=1 FL=1